MRSIRVAWVLTMALAAAPGARAAGAYIVTSDQPAFAEAARAAAAALPGATVLRADESARAAVSGADVGVVVGPLAERMVGSFLSSTARAVAVLTPRAASLPMARSVSIPVAAGAGDVLGLLRVVLPSARRVAVFPAAGSDAASLTDQVRAAGLEPVLPKAGEPFPAAVDRLVGAADVVWIEDTSSIPAGGGALVVKAAADAGKHVVGPNRATVLQGALYAVVPDPATQGRTAGEVAARIMGGEQVGAVPPPEGRIVLNAARARVLGLKLPQSVARRAESVE